MSTGRSLRRLRPQQPLRERRIVDGERDDGGRGQRQEYAAETAGSDAPRPRDRPQYERDRQQDHHQPVRLEFHGTRCRKGVDPDRDEPHDRHERDQREHARGRLRHVDRSINGPLDGHADSGRGSREARRPWRQQQPHHAGTGEQGAPGRDRCTAQRQRRNQGEHRRTPAARVRVRACEPRPRMPVADGRWRRSRLRLSRRLRYSVRLAS